MWRSEPEYSSCCVFICAEFFVFFRCDNGSIRRLRNPHAICFFDHVIAQLLISSPGDHGSRIVVGPAIGPIAYSGTKSEQH